jgi:lipopolysaccharide transport system permease protein
MRHFQALKRQYEFIWYRALAEIRSDVSRGFLGFVWWVAEPIFYMAVFYVIFGLVFKQNSDNYVAFLLCGLVVWKWFDSSIRNASVSIQHSMGLINQVYLPKIVFPLVSLVNSTLRFGIVFSLLLGFLIIQGLVPTISWLVDLPLLLLLQILLMTGIGMTFAAIVPFVPDIKFLLDNGMMLLFFLSGIFFRFENIPDSLLPYFKLNPIAMLIASYRHILLTGHSPNWNSLIPVIVITIFFLLLGGYLLHKYNRSYAKRAFL